MSLVNNFQKSRYEIDRDGQLAFIDYKFTQQTNRIYLIHTEVPPSMRGKGMGEELVIAVLEDIKKNGWNLIPLCPFVVAYLKRHPEYHSIIDPKNRSKFNQ